MAVAYETSLPIAANITFAAAGETENVAFDAGSGSDRVLLVHIFWRDNDNRTITGVTYNGVAMSTAATGAKVTINNRSAQLWALANPASGSNTIAVTMGAGGGDSQAIICAWVGNTADVSGTPVDGYTSNTGSGSTAAAVSSVTISSAADDRVVVFHSIVNDVGPWTATPTNYTERQDGADSNYNLCTSLGDANGAASVATSATWNNGADGWNWIALGVNINQSAGAAAPVRRRGAITTLGVG